MFKARKIALDMKQNKVEGQETEETADFIDMPIWFFCLMKWNVLNLRIRTELAQKMSDAYEQKSYIIILR